jgi:protein-L-isoaspartate O-methyltransferase
MNIDIHMLQSFHFSPRLPGKDWASSESAHEARLAALLKLGPGKKCLDVGCGVGGPMRTIASTSGAHVTGITINDYQVERGVYHNKRVSPLRIGTIGHAPAWKFTAAALTLSAGSNVPAFL